MKSSLKSSLGVVLGCTWPQAELNPGRGGGVLAARSETVSRCELKQRRARDGVELGVRLVRPLLLNAGLLTISRILLASQLKTYKSRQ